MKYIKYTIITFATLLYWSCEKCEKPILVPCGGSDENPKVDLVVIMDQSGSMDDEAIAVSDASEIAIDAVKDSCNTDLRVKYLGVDGVSWATTVFDTSHRDYLYDLHGPSLPLAADTLIPIGQSNEQGADAIADLSANFDWRAGACRGILYISDEPIDGNTTVAVTNTAVANAIAVANQNSVTVFNIYIPGMGSPFDAQVHYDQYSNLSDNTGGAAFFDDRVDTTTYINLMPRVVCNSCNNCNLNNFLN